MSDKPKRRPPHSTPWSFDEALEVIRELAPLLAKHGWGVGLTGSVLLKGSSDNDLDLIVYPLDSGKVDVSYLHGFSSTRLAGGSSTIRSRFTVRGAVEVRVTASVWRCGGRRPSVGWTYSS